MTEAAVQDRPAWARDNAFARKPESAPFGLVDGKGKEKGFETLNELQDYLGSGKGRLALVWTPLQERLVAPEEIPELASSLRKRGLIFARQDVEEARRTLLFTGPAVVYGVYAMWREGSPLGLPALDFLVMTIFAFLYFTARPWWESRKGRRAVQQLTPERMAAEIPEARFDLWMESQKAPVTIVLAALVGLVWVVQFFTPGLGIAEAGFDKIRYRMGEEWRLFTGAFLHGNLIHFLLNAGAFYYLARRVEILARWPHLAVVFFLSLLGAGWASLIGMPLQTTVGISGVVCGFLGFLLLFETLHLRLVPRPARRRLLAILISLVVIGILGFLFIDNWAHFGGLLTGAAYALVVFPKSSSPQRPRILEQDYLVGAISLLLIGISAAGAVAAMIL